MVALLLILIIFMLKFFASFVMAGCLTYGLYLNPHRQELVTKSVNLAQHLEGSFYLALHRGWTAYYDMLDRLEGKSYRSYSYFSDK